MVVSVNVSEVELVKLALKELSPLVLESLGPLMNFLKAASIVFIVYIIFLIYRGFMRMQDHRRLKRIEEKLDLLLKKKLKSK